MHTHMMRLKRSFWRALSQASFGYLSSTETAGARSWTAMLIFTTLLLSARSPLQQRFEGAGGRDETVHLPNFLLVAADLS